MMFVVKATFIESTDLPCSLVRRLGLHFHPPAVCWKVKVKKGKAIPVTGHGGP
jgi:hypothetical protein